MYNLMIISFMMFSTFKGNFTLPTTTLHGAHFPSSQIHEFTHLLSANY